MIFIKQSTIKTSEHTNERRKYTGDSCGTNGLDETPQ